MRTGTLQDLVIFIDPPWSTVRHPKVDVSHWRKSQYGRTIFNRCRISVVRLTQRQRHVEPRSARLHSLPSFYQSGLTTRTVVTDFLQVRLHKRWLYHWSFSIYMSQWRFNLNVLSSFFFMLDAMTSLQMTNANWSNVCHDSRPPRSCCRISIIQYISDEWMCYYCPWSCLV